MKRTQGTFRRTAQFTAKLTRTWKDDETSTYRETAKDTHAMFFFEMQEFPMEKDQGSGHVGGHGGNGMCEKSSAEVEEWFGTHRVVQESPCSTGYARADITCVCTVEIRKNII